MSRCINLDFFIFLYNIIFFVCQKMSLSMILKKFLNFGNLSLDDSYKKNSYKKKLCMNIPYFIHFSIQMFRYHFIIILNPYRYPYPHSLVKHPTNFFLYKKLVYPNLWPNI